jgi:transposase InsO family protein
MPWKETDAMTQKRKFVFEALGREKSFTELCSEYGISTKTGYKWKARFLQSGWPGLDDRSRRPKTTGMPLPEEVVLEIIRLKNAKKNWGPYKIRKLYIRNHPDRKPPARSSFERVLERAGFTVKKKRRRYAAAERIQNRIQPKGPNDVWTVDFKGWWYTQQKDRVNPLTVRDEFSKMILSITVVEKGDIFNVKAEFVRLFKKYGLPRSIRSDNGPPFASPFNALGLTKLAVWWLALGIVLDRIDPGCPYQNGGHERMHLDMKRELEGQIAGGLQEQQHVMDEWKEEFNTERPHQALDGKRPADVYEPSQTKYDPEIEDLQYPKGYQLRKVNDRGFMCFRGGRYFVGNPFAGYSVGILLRRDGTLQVWFSSLLLGELVAETGEIRFTSKPERAKTS